MKKIKVAIDFDETLDHTIVQIFVKEMMADGIDVHVVTNNHVCDYVLETTNELNIPEKNVHFIGYLHKYVYFSENFDYEFHLDNDYQDVNEINLLTKVDGILFDEGWKESCIAKIKRNNG